MRIICIGDPHIQVSNFIEVEQLHNKVEELLDELKPDLVVILGDVLHTHEKIHSMAMNRACSFIDMVRKRSRTFLLVGNHDAYSNQIFLSDDHWMNQLKEWDNLTVVDKPMTLDTPAGILLFVPYVYPGRFFEALDTVPSWKKSRCIFAHQEFAGCKMGAIVSEIGDQWSEDFPDVISGHIHSNQRINNVYYPGASLQQAFGESERNIIAYTDFVEHEKGYVLEEIDLGLPRKKTIYADISEMDDIKIPNGEDKIRITVSGDHNDFKTFKKTKQYKDLIDKDVKIVFKQKKSIAAHTEQVRLSICEEGKDSTFLEIVSSSVMREKNPYLFQVYEQLALDRINNVSDTFFI